MSDAEHKDALDTGRDPVESETGKVLVPVSWTTDVYQNVVPDWENAIYCEPDAADQWDCRIWGRSRI